MTWVVDVTYDWDHYGSQDETYYCETVEEAAQRYENEALVGNQPLSEIVEELGWEGLRLESFDPETRKRVVASELVEAVG